MGSLQERIAKRAYELFLARGGLHGYHIQDWAQAEKEIAEQDKLSKKKEEESKKSNKPEEKTSEEKILKADQKPVEPVVEAPKPKRARATAASPSKKKAAKKKVD